MRINRIGFVLLCALLRFVPLFGQDTLAVKGQLNDTLVLNNATVTARSQEQQLREGAYAVSAVNIRLQAATLQSLTQAIDRSSGIRIREEGGVGSDFDLSINGLSGNSIRYFLDGMPLDAKGTGITLSNLKYIEVTGLFTPRGGISIYPYANYGRPGTRYEALADQRFANHE